MALWDRITTLLLPHVAYTETGEAGEGCSFLLRDDESLSLPLGCLWHHPGEGEGCHVYSQLMVEV